MTINPTAGRFSEVPPQLRDRGWIIWRYNAQGGKQPIAGWGSLGEPLSFDEARRRHEVDGVGDGVGVLLGEGLGGVDLDACLGADGRIADWASEWIEHFDGTYCEVSPSGTGLKLFALGAPPRLSRTRLAMGPKIDGQKQVAVEAYVSGRWFAVTGRRWGTGGHTVASKPAAWAWAAERIGAHTAAVEAARRAPVVQVDPERLEAMLERIDVEQYRDQDAWFRLMAACHHVTNGDGREAFIAWSISDGVYSDHAEIIGQRWDSLTVCKPGGLTGGPLWKALREAGAGDLIPTEFVAKREAEQLRFDDWKPNHPMLDFAEWKPRPLRFGDERGD
jgi:hypothetical protein